MGFAGEAMMLSRIMMPCGGNLGRGSVFPGENVQPAGANGAQYIGMLGLLLALWWRRFFSSWLGEQTTVLQIHPGQVFRDHEVTLLS
jgi:hypothetical protein